MSHNKISAFISSTIGELHNERIAIKKRLDSREIDSFAFEFDIGSRPESVEKAFLGEVENSDIYIGIFWNQYSSPTISEYRKAKGLGKPLFIYIKNYCLKRDKELQEFLEEISSPLFGITYSTFNNAFELADNVERDINRWLVRQWKNRINENRFAPPKRKIKRLTFDAANTLEFVAQNPFIKILETKGNPPQVYLLEFKIKSISKISNEGHPIYSNSHVVSLKIDDNYPLNPPPVKINSPIFHPNIFLNGRVCLGYHKLPYTLVDIIVQVAKMINFESYSIDLPSNLDAAKWLSQNESYCPTDNRLVINEPNFDRNQSFKIR